MSTFAKYDHDWLHDDLADLRKRGIKAPRGMVCAYLRTLQFRALGGDSFPKLARIASDVGWPKTTLFRLLKDEREWSDPDRADEWTEWKDENEWNADGTETERSRNARGMANDGSSDASRAERNDSGTLAERARNESGHTRGILEEEKNKKEEESSAHPPKPAAPEQDTTPEAEAVARLHAAWQAHDTDFPICDPKPIFGMLVHAPGDTADEREAVVRRVLDFVATAPAGREHPWGDTPDFLRRQGAGVLRVALDLANNRERWSSLVAWSAKWDRARRPTRIATKPTDGSDAPSATPVWDSMREAIERLPYRSIFGERTQAGVMLHPDPVEHARRALAFRRAGDRDGYLSTLETFGDAARAAAVARFAASFERHYAELAAVEAA